MAMFFDERADEKGVPQLKELTPSVVSQMEEIKTKVEFLRKEVNYHFSWRKKSHYYVHWMILCRRLTEFLTATGPGTFEFYARQRLAENVELFSFKYLGDLLERAAWHDNQFTSLKQDKKTSEFQDSAYNYADYSSAEGDALQLDIYSEMSRLFPTGRSPEDKYAKLTNTPIDRMDKLFWYRYFGDSARRVKIDDFIKALRFHLIHVHDTPLPPERNLETISEDEQKKRQLAQQILDVGHEWRDVSSIRKAIARADLLTSTDDAKDRGDPSKFDAFETMVRVLLKEDDPDFSGFGGSDSSGAYVSDESFATFMGMFSPLSKCYERMSGVFDMPTFNGEVQKASWFKLELGSTAASLLVLKPDVRFVLRASEADTKKNYFVLVYHNGIDMSKPPLHCRVFLTAQGYILDGDPRAYDTIRRLIVAVTTEKGITRSSLEQKQVTLWAEALHRERTVIDEERKEANYRINTYSDIAQFMKVEEPDTFRVLEEAMVECSYDSKTRTDYAQIFLYLDTDYSGALDSAEFASGVPQLFGPAARKWEQAKYTHPLIGRLTQDITAVQIPLESFTMALADPMTKIYLLESAAKTKKQQEEELQQFKDEHGGRAPNREDLDFKMIDNLKTWFRDFDEQCRVRAEELLGVTTTLSDKPRGFLEEATLFLIELIGHLAFFPVWVVVYWFKQFGLWRRAKGPVRCYRSIIGGLVMVLMAGFYGVPFLSLVVWRYYGNDQFAHDVNVYEIIVPVVMVILFSFVLCPLGSFARLRSQRWILSKARIAQLFDTFAAFKQYLKPTYDRGGDMQTTSASRRRTFVADRIRKVVNNTRPNDNQAVELVENKDDEPLLTQDNDAQAVMQLAEIFLPAHIRSHRNEETTAGREELVERDIIDRDVTPLLPVQHRNSILIYAIIAAGIHGCIPGVYRELERSGTFTTGDTIIFGEAPFFGNGWQEHLCSIVHLVFGVFAGFWLSIWLQNAMHWFNEQALAMTNINHLTSARSASQSKLKFFLPLDNVKCVNFWLLMRERAKEQIDITIHAVIAVSLLFMLSLVVAVFVRIIILGTDIDIFAVTALYDILFLIVHLFAIMIAAVRLNNENRDSVVWLEYQKFRYAMEIQQIRADTDHVPAAEIPHLQTEKLKALTRKLALVECTMSKIQRMETPVTILGLVVDQAFLVQVLAFVFAGAGAGLAQLINNSRQ